VTEIFKMIGSTAPLRGSIRITLQVDEVAILQAGGGFEAIRRPRIAYRGRKETSWEGLSCQFG
jgi:hypothetical protein